MPPPVLSKEEVQANLLRRKHAKDFIQVLLRTEVRESSNTEVI